jgi:hypothetical protein
MQIVIGTDGSARCLYSEAIDLEHLGAVTISRASHVEPDDSGQWFASIIDGPVLGPFLRRSAALQAEADWLNANRLTAASCDER